MHTLQLDLAQTYIYRGNMPPPVGYKVSNKCCLYVRRKSVGTAIFDIRISGNFVVYGYQQSSVLWKKKKKKLLIYFYITRKLMKLLIWHLYQYSDHGILNIVSSFYLKVLCLKSLLSSVNWHVCISSPFIAIQILVIHIVSNSAAHFWWFPS